MNLYLLLATLTIVNAGVVPDTECDGVIIDGNYYDKEILKTGIIEKGTNGTIYFLNVNHNYNITYLINKVNKNHFESVLFDLNTKEIKKIDVPFAGSATVDQNTDNLYVRGKNCIYKYNYKNQTSELYASIDDDSIWKIYFKDVLYFIKSQSKYSQSVYTYIDGNITRFKDMEDIEVHEFIIDGEDNIVFRNGTGFYKRSKGSKDAFLYDNSLFGRQFTTDIHGNVYMIAVNRLTQDKEELYKVDKKSTSLEKLTDLSPCCGLGFDGNNNIIYSDCTNLVRLNINKDKTC